MATTSDLADIISTVGREHVDVFTVAKGTQDPHHIEAKPSFMVKFHRADLVVAHGLELESAWLEPLIIGAKNPNIALGTKGHLEIGEFLEPLEIPQNQITRAQGDVHPGGNPHFQLDPIRMGKAAVLVAQRLGQLDPEHKKDFEQKAKAFVLEMQTKTKLWQKRIEATGIKEIVTHHKTMTYFCHRFQIKCQLQLEPKPGIPPTASHLLFITKEMKERNLKLVLIENYFDDQAVAKLQTELPDIKSQRVPVSVGGEEEIKNLSDLYERLVQVFEKAQS